MSGVAKWECPDCHAFNFTGEMCACVRQINDTTTQPVLASDMTLLDWFAGEALTGLAANPVKYNGKTYEYAHDAYQFAEAMMLERERRAGK